MNCGEVFTERCQGVFPLGRVEDSVDGHAGDVSLIGNFQFADELEGKLGIGQRNSAQKARCDTYAGLPGKQVAVVLVPGRGGGWVGFHAVKERNGCGIATGVGIFEQIGEIGQNFQRGLGRPARP